VVRVDREGAWLRITHAGPRGARLRADKGLNFPDTELSLPPLSDKDRADLDFVVRHADMVGFSFVESREDMEVLMRALADRGATQLPVVAKIETNRAVRNLPDIILGALGRHPLAIMIARGDLSVELGSVRLAEIQEEILWVCEAAHVPVVWATQVLETMTKKGVRSRPEFTDAAMGVRAECVMLNKGPHVVDAVRALGAVLERMEAPQYKKISRLRALHWQPPAIPSLRGFAFAPSGVEVGDEPALQPGDRLLELQLAFFQSTQLQLIGVGGGRQLADVAVQYTMLAAQFVQLPV